MNPVSRRFLLVAVLSAFFGMSLGMAMGATGNFILAPVHAHINLLGWVSMSLFGLFYQCVPSAAAGPLPQVHFWLSSLGANLMAPSLAGSVLGYHAMHPVLVLAGSLSMAGILCFSAVVLRLRQTDPLQTSRLTAAAQPGWPEAFYPEPLTEPTLNLSIHAARATQ